MVRRLHFLGSPKHLSTWLLAAVVVGSVCGCAPSGKEPQAPRSAALPPSPTAPKIKGDSPLGTLRRLHDYRIAGQTGKLADHVRPDLRPRVLELIHTVDEVAAANDVLQASLVKRFGRASATLFDRSAVVNILGIFSRDMETIDQRVEGDHAVVTIQVAGRLPLEEVRLVRLDGGWLLETDPPVDGLAKELGALAALLTDVARRVDERPMTIDQVRRELEAREAAVGRRISDLCARK